VAAFDSRFPALVSNTSCSIAKWARPGAYPRVEYLRGASLPAHTILSCKGLQATITSLFQEYITYDHYFFKYKINHWYQFRQSAVTVKTGRRIVVPLRIPAVIIFVIVGLLVDDDDTVLKTWMGSLGSATPI
jgi:hypothetical protein